MAVKSVRILARKGKLSVEQTIVPGELIITYKGLDIIVVVNRCKLLSMYSVYVSLTFELHTLFIRLHIRFLNLMREILDEGRIKMIRTE